METKHPVQVTIADDSTAEKCDAHCGVDWLSHESVSLATKRIKERFGNRVRLAYFDLGRPNINRRALELSQQVKGKNLSLPVLIINGHPRISGEFDIRQLLDAIEVEVEIRR